MPVESTLPTGHWIYVDTDPSLHARIKLEDFTVNLAHWTVTLVNPNQPLGLIFHEIDWHCRYLAERAEETLPVQHRSQGSWATFCHLQLFSGKFVLISERTL